jgi:DNA gyrase inhibitor GyrI
MDKIDVRIVQLEPMRVASFHGFGPEPELEAWAKLAKWAKPKGILDDREKYRIFGFNNPNPSPGSPNYGYEFWINLGSEVYPGEDIEIKNIPGGLYAVARCVIQGRPYETIPAAWKTLVLWREESPYSNASHQWLEEHIAIGSDPEGDWDLDLYLPISE